MFENREEVNKEIRITFAEKVDEINTRLKNMGSPIVIQHSEIIDPFIVTVQGKSYIIPFQSIIDATKKQIEHITDGDLKEAIYDSTAETPRRDPRNRVI
jgi:hypothetical protein